MSILPLPLTRNKIHCHELLLSADLGDIFNWQLTHTSSCTILRTTSVLNPCHWVPYTDKFIRPRLELCDAATEDKSKYYIYLQLPWETSLTAALGDQPYSCLGRPALQLPWETSLTAALETSLWLKGPSWR